MTPQKRNGPAGSTRDRQGPKSLNQALTITIDHLSTILKPSPRVFLCGAVLRLFSRGLISRERACWFIERLRLPRERS